MSIHSCFAYACSEQPPGGHSFTTTRISSKQSITQVRLSQSRYTCLTLPGLLHITAISKAHTCCSCYKKNSTCIVHTQQLCYNSLLQLPLTCHGSVHIHTTRCQMACSCCGTVHLMLCMKDKHDVLQCTTHTCAHIIPIS
jgi:hypothetical protein